MKLTPWYPPHIKPVRVGVYETFPIGSHATYFQHWDGIRWSITGIDEENAFHWRNYHSKCKPPSWRGLAHPPQSHNNPSAGEKK